MEVFQAGQPDSFWIIWRGRAKGLLFVSIVPGFPLKMGGSKLCGTPSKKILQRDFAYAIMSVGKMK